jgi:hypothetical protein
MRKKQLRQQQSSKQAGRTANGGPAHFFRLTVGIGPLDLMSVRPTACLLFGQPCLRIFIDRSVGGLSLGGSWFCVLSCCAHECSPWILKRLIGRVQRVTTVWQAAVCHIARKSLLNEA